MSINSAMLAGVSGLVANALSDGGTLQAATTTR